jgi:tetrapyrrole methylase family protein/MazG family protein
MITIVGLGPGSPEALTLGTLDVLENGSKIFLRTEKHPTVEYLSKRNFLFETYDSKYEEGSSFDEVYENIAKDLIEEHDKFGDLVYAVPGHPLVAEKSVFNIMNICEERNIEYKIIPAVSFVDVMMESLKIDPIEGLKILDAFELDSQILDKRIGTIITQVYNPFIASEVKLKLSEYYNDDTQIFFVRAAGIKGMESIRKIPLYELDRQDDIDYLTSIYIPKDLDNKKDFYDLVSIIETLRGEDGCPWDREQTHDSLKSALIEESYEVIDAIESEDEDAIIEELGDVLLQVVFHASIGKEEEFFSINDVIEGICNKMIYRHPHVFGEESINTSSKVLESWDELKKKEKGIDSVTEEMRSIARSLPALIRANKVQKKAKKVGFDWDEVEEAMNKVIEELNEIKEVYNGQNKEIITEEVGDLIFACVNICRFLDIDGELALNKTTEKFIKRFSFIEEKSKEVNKNMKEMSLDEMNKLWEDAKKLKK